MQQYHNSNEPRLNAAFRFELFEVLFDRSVVALAKIQLARCGCKAGYRTLKCLLLEILNFVLS